MQLPIPIVISLGGSLVVPPAGIDTDFLEAFRELLLEQIAKDKRFILIVGGGKTAREYMNAASGVVPLTDDDKDWLGIHATRLNGHLLRTVFRQEAHREMIKNPDYIIEWAEPVLVAAGWRPGHSTDYVAVRMGLNYGAKQVLNLSNVSQVFDKDPNKFSDATPLDSLTWPEFQKLVGDSWSPGSSAPFDPIASKLAAEHLMTVTIADGKNIENLRNILETGAGVKTDIHPLDEAALK